MADGGRGIRLAWLCALGFENSLKEEEEEEEGFCGSWRLRTGHYLGVGIDPMHRRILALGVRRGERRRMTAWEIGMRISTAPRGRRIAFV